MVYAAKMRMSIINHNGISLPRNNTTEGSTFPRTIKPPFTNDYTSAYKKRNPNEMNTDI